MKEKEEMLIEEMKMKNGLMIKENLLFSKKLGEKLMLLNLLIILIKEIMLEGMLGSGGQGLVGYPGLLLDKDWVLILIEGIIFII